MIVLASSVEGHLVRNRTGRAGVEDGTQNQSRLLEGLALGGLDPSSICLGELYTPISHE